jgi:hypothetical protein
MLRECPKNASAAGRGTFEALLEDFRSASRALPEHQANSGRNRPLSRLTGYLKAVWPGFGSVFEAWPAPGAREGPHKCGGASPSTFLQGFPGEWPRKSIGRVHVAAFWKLKYVLNNSGSDPPNPNKSPGNGRKWRPRTPPTNNPTVKPRIKNTKYCPKDGHVVL